MEGHPELYDRFSKAQTDLAAMFSGEIAAGQSSQLNLVNANAGMVSSHAPTSTAKKHSKSRVCTSTLLADAPEDANSLGLL